jgi:hypothetical protein
MFLSLLEFELTAIKQAAEKIGISKMSNAKVQMSNKIQGSNVMNS